MPLEVPSSVGCVLSLWAVPVTFPRQSHRAQRGLCLLVALVGGFQVALGTGKESEKGHRLQAFLLRGPEN